MSFEEYEIGFIAGAIGFNILAYFAFKEVNPLMVGGIIGIGIAMVIKRMFLK